VIAQPDRHACMSVSTVQLHDPQCLLTVVHGVLAVLDQTRYGRATRRSGGVIVDGITKATL